MDAMSTLFSLLFVFTDSLTESLVNSIRYPLCANVFLSKLDVEKGEAMAYSTAIIKEFVTEFPNARLIVAYDIACRMNASIRVTIVIYIKVKYLLSNRMLTYPSRNRSYLLCIHIVIN